MKLSSVMLILGCVFAFLCLCMPWCYGYFMEAGRNNMANSAQIFGWLTFVCAFLTLGSVPLFAMEGK